MAIWPTNYLKRFIAETKFMVLMNEEYIQLPNRRDHNCFGCSPVNASGLQMTFYANETAVFSKVTVPEHLCGWNNLVHGGVLSTILD